MDHNINFLNANVPKAVNKPKPVIEKIQFTDEQSRTPSPLCDLGFKLNNSQQFYCGSNNSFVQDCSRKGKDISCTYGNYR